LVEIRVENLEYVYNEGTPIEKKALAGTSFTLGDGRFLGILGGTGSGKTTLIRILGGFLTPTQGRVLVDGKDVRDRGSGPGRKMGVVFQRPERQLFEETVFREISFVLRRFSELSDAEIERSVRNACDLVGLDMERIADRSPHDLSDGEKRKVVIAAVLVNEPETLILDESAVGLDPPSLADLVAVLQRMKESKEKTVVLVSHDMESFLPLLDMMVVLDRGRMAAAGSPAEVCLKLGDDPFMRDLLPGVAVLVHDLRKGGLPVAPDEFRISALADQMADLRSSSGGNS